jgi:hypothetical protein
VAVVAAVQGANGERRRRRIEKYELLFSLFLSPSPARSLSREQTKRMMRKFCII